MFPEGTYTTLDAKRAQETLLFTGGPDAALRVLIVGSCRALPYLNYIAAYNRSSGRDVFYAGYVNAADLRTTVDDKPQDFDAAANRLLSNARGFLSGVDILLCEHIENYGALNTNEREVGIRSKLHAHTKVFTVPNWNAMGVLRNDVLSLHGEKLRWELSDVEHGALAADSIAKFYRHCAMSSFPEMMLAFDTAWRAERWFWTHNHVARPFTEFIFSQWLMKLGLDPMPKEALDHTRSFDLFATPHTAVTEQDVEVLKILWK
jgi:hypothetical protein